MAALIGVKNGRLTVFHEHAPVTPTAAAPPHSDIIRGGLRDTLLPVGVALLQAAGVGLRDVFVLVVDNDRTSVACILAAMGLKCVCILVSKSRAVLLPHVLQQTRLTKIISVDGEKLTTTERASQTTQATWGDGAVLEEGGVGMLTSGSVGEPKVVLCSWERMLLQGQSTHEQLFPNGPARIICGTSISHAYSINAIFALLQSRYDAESELCFVSDTTALYELLSNRSDKVTMLYGTPATYTRLLELPAQPLYADVAYSAGTRLSRELFERTLSHSGLQLMQNYGSTETGDIAAWNLVGTRFAEEAKFMEDEERIYVGNLWPGVRVQVTVDGEVLVWTPWQSMGYVIDGDLYLSGGAPHRTADKGLVVVRDTQKTQLWLEGRIRLPLTLKLGPKRPQWFQAGEIEELFKSKADITDVLALMQDPAVTHTSIRVRIVLCDGSSLSVTDLRCWAAKELAIPELALEIEQVKFLPCSPAGKLMYR